jgi:hypothetical protein
MTHTGLEQLHHVHLDLGSGSDGDCLVSDAKGP